MRSALILVVGQGKLPPDEFPVTVRLGDLIRVVQQGDLIFVILPQPTLSHPS